MGYVISLMFIFVGPLLVFALSGWIHQRYVLLSMRSLETKEDYNRRLDERMRKNPGSFDPRTADEETLRQRRSSGCFFMAVPTIAYILFVIMAMAVRG